MKQSEITHFSLFSGIGGIDLAAEWAGFETVGQCEIDDYATRVLEKNFPGAERWRDIRDVTVESFRERTGINAGELTLLSGGLPCQPETNEVRLCLAGKRKASADERDLWGEFARIIREIRPLWVVAENVPALLTSESGRYFGRYFETWTKWGIMSGGVVIPLPGLEPYIDETGFLLLPTPTASDGISMKRSNKKNLQVCLHRLFQRNLNKTQRTIYYLFYLGMNWSQTSEYIETMMGFPKGWTDTDV